MKIIKLTDEQFDDLISCIHFTLINYDKKGASEFMKSARKIKVKLWKLIRSK